jgi:hypothetical protein
MIIHFPKNPLKKSAAFGARGQMFGDFGHLRILQRTRAKCPHFQTMDVLGHERRASQNERSAVSSFFQYVFQYNRR